MQYLLYLVHTKGQSNDDQRNAEHDPFLVDGGEVWDGTKTAAATATAIHLQIGDIADGFPQGLQKRLQRWQGFSQTRYAFGKHHQGSRLVIIGQDFDFVAALFGQVQQVEYAKQAKH